jgi:hypothetical protein
MNASWDYFWPAFAAGLVVGLIAGLIAFRLRRTRKQRYGTLTIGVLVSVALAMLWHGPLGAADRFADEVERTARSALVYNEIPQVSAHLHRGPLTRRIVLSGPADDFQRSELVRIMGDLPGVGSAQWTGEPAGVPLIADGAGVALVGFLFGLFVAYLIELRRRYNAQWNW